MIFQCAAAANCGLANYSHACPNQSFPTPPDAEFPADVPPARELPAGLTPAWLCPGICPGICPALLAPARDAPDLVDFGFAAGFLSGVHTRITSWIDVMPKANFLNPCSTRTIILFLRAKVRISSTGRPVAMALRMSSLITKISKTRTF